MAIATSTAILASAAVAAGATAYGASKSSKAAKDAAGAAQQSADQNNALQREMFNQNNALQRQVRDENIGYISPFMQRGNAAGDSINALLGLPTNSQAVASGGYNTAPPQAPVAPAAPDWAQYGAQNPDVAAEYQRLAATADRNSPWFAEHGLDRGPEGFYQWHYQNYGQNEGRQAPVAAPQPQAQQQAAQQQAGPAASAVDPAGASKAAFQSYLNSTGHQFRLQSGSDAISSNRATSGLLRSGATLKALTKYGQDVGTGDFNNYLGLLSGQQSVGLTGANALAGIGTNYANSVGNAGANYAGAVSGNNDSAASARGNAALIGAGQTNALMGQLGSTLGSLGSSYAGGGWGNSAGAAASAEAARIRGANPFGGY